MGLPTHIRTHKEQLQFLKREKLYIHSFWCFVEQEIKGKCYCYFIEVNLLCLILFWPGILKLTLLVVLSRGRPRKHEPLMYSKYRGFNLGNYMFTGSWKAWRGWDSGSHQWWYSFITRAFQVYLAGFWESQELKQAPNTMSAFSSGAATSRTFCPLSQLLSKPGNNHVCL